MELYKPFAASGTLTSRARVADVLDKGSGALILTEGMVQYFDYIFLINRMHSLILGFKFLVPKYIDIKGVRLFLAVMNHLSQYRKNKTL